MMNNQINYIVG